MVESNDIIGIPAEHDGFVRDVASAHNGADAAFIAASRTDVPALCAALRESVAREDGARAAIEHDYHTIVRLRADAEVLRGKLHEATERAERAEALAAAWKELRGAERPRSTKDDDRQRRAACDRLLAAYANLRALGVEP
jgi:murein endopeptidase